jgi:uncharacterized glyoxalase superfamily protein PhnB
MEIKQVFDVVVTPDPQASVEFFRRCFGFDAVVDLEWYVHLRHECGAEIAFMAADHESQPAEYRTPISGLGFIFSIEVEDADRALGQLLEAGCAITQPIVTEPWGQRHFGLTDPSGLMIDIVATAAAMEE